MQKDILEIDVDGVLLDIHNGLNPHLRRIYRDFEGDKLIERWSMRELDMYDKRLRPKALELFGNADYISNLSFFNGALEALVDLYAYSKQANCKIIINSNVRDEACVKARLSDLEKRVKTAGISYDAVVTCLPQKQKLNSFVIVDDYPENLRHSEAPVKIMVRRGHNRYTKLSELGKCKSLHVVDSFVDATVIIKALLSFKNAGLFI